MCDVSTESRLKRVDQEIARLQLEIARIERERSPYEVASSAAQQWLSYLRFKKWLRAPADSYDLWKVGFVLVGSATVAALCFIIGISALQSPSAAVLASAISSASGAWMLYRFLYRPSDALLRDQTVEAEIDLQVATVQLKNVQAADGLANIQEQRQRLLQEKRELSEKLRAEIASGVRLRATLLQQNWKAMRGYEWEDFLVIVCGALGAQVERIGGAGDQGVDLIVIFGLRRIAIQAKGYEGAVNNKAVQEVYAGMAHHRCSACAVITNSRFQASAFELARSTKCVLIGEDEFPGFVLGKLDLQSLVNSIANLESKT